MEQAERSSRCHTSTTFHIIVTWRAIQGCWKPLLSWNVRNPVWAVENSLWRICGIHCQRLQLISFLTFFTWRKENTYIYQARFKTHWNNTKCLQDQIIVDLKILEPDQICGVLNIFYFLLTRWTQISNVSLFLSHFIYIFKMTVTKDYFF